MIQKINYADKQTGGKFSASDANVIKSTVNLNADVLSENSQSILSLQGGQLGPIKPTDAAPTPARNGNYTFSIGGAKPAWLTAEAGVTTVKAGDGVAMVYIAPSTYIYTHVNVSSDFVTIKSILDINSRLVKSYIEQTGTSESVDGYYSFMGEFVPFSDYKSKKFAIDATRNYYATSLVNGGPLALARYYNSAGGYISSEKPGTNAVNEQYTRELLTIPDNAAFVGLSGKTNFAILYIGEYGTLEDHEDRIYMMEESAKDYWTGKKIVWFGTSIPQTGYPQVVGAMLGATMVNEAQGSSMARRGKIDVSDGYGWTGLAWQNVGYALCQTIAEKTTLINDWNTWKTILSNTPPTTLDSSTQSLFLDCSFENRLYRHLASKGGTNADLYVFDHGHNDNLVSDSDDQFINVPASSRDKNTFIGSMNFIIDEILKNNPRARICFIGHYENARKTRISQAQETLAEYWDFPLIKLWQRTGWSQQQVITTGYWSNGVWIQSGGTSQTLTMTQIWMQDDLHPSSTATKEFLAGILAEYIKKIR